MTRSRITDGWHLLLGVFALALATSCVPQDAHRGPSHGTPQPRPEGAALLRGLALTVPSDIVDSAPAVSTAGIPAAPLSGAPAFAAPAQAPDDANRAADCLTAAVYYEARSQSPDGQRAVAQVVLNRVRDRAFPNSVCGVVYQGSTRRTGCQFSFTCDGSMYHRRDEGAWVRARAIAAAALSGEVYVPVGSATFYHANSVLPWWAGSLARIGSVGAHIFYRWRGAMENSLAFRQHYAGIEPTLGAGSAAGPVDAVVVHYANEVVGGVTVHRGEAAAEAAKATVMFVSGVRIHRGGQAAALADPPVTGAVVSEETDRI